MATSAFAYTAPVEPIDPQKYSLVTFTPDKPEHGYFDHFVAIGGDWYKCTKYFATRPETVVLPEGRYYDAHIEWNEK